MSNDAGFKFCILAAGRGTRNSSLNGLHKALLPVSNRPVISVILDRVPKHVPIVVAVGYKKEQIISYLQHVHPERHFSFVAIDNYDGPGSGPGLSLLQCRQLLECPFIFTSVDTIDDEDVLFTSVEKNWVGVSRTNDKAGSYCLVGLDDRTKLVNNFFYGNHEDPLAFTGIAAIYDHGVFWESLSKKDLIKNEHQVLNGFSDLGKIFPRKVEWIDTGNDAAYADARRKYPNDVVIEKDNEVLFIDNGKVVKYFSDEDKLRQRVKRTLSLPAGCPKVAQINENMFCYDYVDGVTLSNVHDEKILRTFLHNYYDQFSSTVSYEKDRFIKDCDKMYREKTQKRIKSFSGSELDLITTINGVSVPSITTLVEKIDWEAIYQKALPRFFHGDLQPENILVTPDNQFLYIDWRESFGQSTSIGDMYYDLGKLYHALLISNQLVMKSCYSLQVNYKQNTAEISYLLKDNLLVLQKALSDFCKKQDLDYNHIRLLGILNYLNIAGLYGDFRDGDYGKFLFLLGKKMLCQLLLEEKK